MKRSDQEFGQLASLGIKNLLLRGTQLKVFFVCRLNSPKFGFDFTGRHLSFILNQMEFVSLSILVQNVSPTDCFLLQNTKFIFGCAVYTGRDTKMSQVNTINDKQIWICLWICWLKTFQINKAFVNSPQNSKITSNKFSSVEKTMNNCFLAYLVLLLLEVSFFPWFLHYRHHVWGFSILDGQDEFLIPDIFLFSVLNCHFLFRSLLPPVSSWSTGLILVMTPSRPSGNIWKDNDLYSKVQPNARTTGILESSTL